MFRIFRTPPPGGRGRAGKANFRDSEAITVSGYFFNKSRGRGRSLRRLASEWTRLRLPAFGVCGEQRISPGAASASGPFVGDESIDFLPGKRRNSRSERVIYPANGDEGRRRRIRRPSQPPRTLFQAWANPFERFDGVFPLSGSCWSRP